MPDYRARYRGQGMTFGRPVLFIQNKFTVKWDSGPVNYLPLWAIETLLMIAWDRFNVASTGQGPSRAAPATPRTATAIATIRT